MTACPHDEAATEAMASRLLLLAFDEKCGADNEYMEFAAWRLGYDIGATGTCVVCVFNVALQLARWYATGCGDAAQRECERWLTDRIVALTE